MSTKSHEFAVGEGVGLDIPHKALHYILVELIAFKQCKTWLGQCR